MPSVRGLRERLARLEKKRGQAERRIVLWMNLGDGLIRRAGSDDVLTEPEFRRLHKDSRRFTLNLGSRDLDAEDRTDDPNAEGATGR